MPFSHFEYLAWVRKKQRAAKYPLTFSGVNPPSLAIFSPDIEDLSLDNSLVFTAFHQAISNAFGIPVESVFSCTGSTGGVFTVLAALLSPGDTIVVEHPTYELLEKVPQSLGANILSLHRRFEDKYRIRMDDLHFLLEQKPKVLLLANPHNPSGILLSNEELKPIIDAAHAVGTIVVVDEVYLPFCEQKSAYHLGAITISSPTKVSGLGDLRTGWIFAPTQYAQALQDATDMSGGYVSLTAARVMIRALLQWEKLRARGIEAQQEGLPVVDAFVSSHPALEWCRPDCGLVGFVRLKHLDTAELFVEKALSAQDVGLVPGRFFGDVKGFRLGFGVPGDILQEGLRRLGELLSR
jgi:aspartate/methionine/tyrosine aminotransferase